MMDTLAVTGSGGVQAANPNFVSGSELPQNPKSMQAYVVAAFNEMDRQLSGKLSPDTRHWNISGGPRVWQITNCILQYVQRRQIDKVRVLNLSGLNEGKPDPVLFDLIDGRLGHGRLSWQIIDHPLSQTFNNAIIKSWLDNRGIERIGQDFRDSDFSVPEGKADVVLCTEILEHLDYTVTTQLLRNCHRALRPGGMLIITTPNAVYLEHRVRMAFGQWDFLHFMDSPEDVDRGLLGHIMYYDSKRLTRHLGNLGFENVEAKTFNAGRGPGELRNLATRAAAVALRTLSRILPYSRQVLLVTAERLA